MKVSCLQENLAKGLSIVSRAVAARSTLPVLGNILLASDNARLRLSATNLELGITCWIGAKIEEEGSTTVPAKTLVDLVNTLPQDKVEMSLVVRTQTLNLSCGRVQANIKGIDAQEFPLIPPANLDDALQLNVEDFREMISHVIFAAATDEARPILTGVLAKIEGGQVTLAAADGFRLSLRTAHLSTPNAEPIQAIIPARALAELGRVITAEEPVFMSLPPGRGQVIFHHDSVELVSQLIEGAFPDYNNVVPKNYTTRTVMSTAEFRKACKTSDIFAREAAHTARLKIKPGSELTPGHVTISATAAETGDNVTELDATVDGGPIEIAFNVKYLVDVLNVMDTPNVALETSTSSSPGVIRPVGRDDFLYVIMPMHLGK
ncbi:MAG: DNA polymerase III subunit beta [Chloroflexi bacterium RBG_16_63_12]|jgi:DNA polymerase-3 subunit beta|nr:MAG: DNA polymerase III subunit beta [Chloroflexi bacterium RBG_16_63_12]